jgi:hypothetical protein
MADFWAFSKDSFIQHKFGFLDSMIIPKITPSQSLCAVCGFCCNGVLFTAVTLQATDDADRLSKLGLNIKKQGRGFRFSQPCPKFTEAGCSIYKHRPGYCSQFDCLLLQKLDRGHISLEEAKGTITKAKAELVILEQALRDAGDQNPSLALNTRFRRIMSQPMDLSVGAEFWKTRNRLMKAVQRFTATVEEKFLQ